MRVVEKLKRQLTETKVQSVTRSVVSNTHKFRQNIGRIMGFSQSNQSRLYQLYHNSFWYI